MLCDRQHARARRVHDETPVLVRSCQIHVVDPDPSDADHPELPFGAFEQLLAKLRPTADDQGVAVADSAAQLVWSEVEAAVNFVGLPEEGQPGVPDLLSHEDCRPSSCGRAGEVGGDLPWRRAAKGGKVGLRDREFEEGGGDHSSGNK